MIGCNSRGQEPENWFVLQISLQKIILKQLQKFESMKPFVLFSLFSLFSNWGPQKEIEVYLFLGEECLISQYYTLPIKQLWQEYADEQVTFIGLFPNPSSSPEKMSAFKEKYQIPFSLAIDIQQEKMKAFDISVTPEVVVYDKRQQQVLYKGRIDNTYFRVGKRRTVTTTAELADVLAAIRMNKAPTIPATPAIGCFITPMRPLLPNAPMCKPVSNQ